MKIGSEIPFLIEHIDSLGQGVSKEGGVVVFIPQTLEGERGIARIVHKKGKVFFGELVSLEEKSCHRTSSECPHFSECGGCHFLHTTYENELLIKEKIFDHLFSRMPFKNRKIVGARERFSYRNRVQLHYDLAKDTMGFLSRKREILEVSECLLPNPQVRETLKRLYREGTWKNQLEGQPLQGHLELYDCNGEVRLSINERYASGGFSQVNEEGNQTLCDYVEGVFKGGRLIDLFGGNGNLSAKLQAETKLVVDFYDEKFRKAGETLFISQNLYAKNSLQSLQSELNNRKQLSLFEKPDLLIVDPPRTGFKGLEEFLKVIKPSNFLYVSCNPATLKRDIENLEDGYAFEEIQLIDLFPGTFHFESTAFFRRRP